MPPTTNREISFAPSPDQAPHLSKDPWLNLASRLANKTIHARQIRKIARTHGIKLKDLLQIYAGVCDSNKPNPQEIMTQLLSLKPTSADKSK